MHIEISVDGRTYEGGPLTEDARAKLIVFLEGNIETCSYLRHRLGDGSELFMGGDLVRRSIFRFVT